MLAAYVDESGDLDTPVFVMAGYVSTEIKWKKFDREWKRVLRDFGVSYFHMKDLVRSKHEFTGWSQQRKDDLIHRVVFVIKSNVMFCIGSALPMADYKKVVPADLRKKIGHPYYLSLQHCIQSVLHHCSSKSITEEVSFTFDEKAKFSGRAVQIYNSYKSGQAITKSGKALLGPIAFADDRNVTPLQAADIMAYEINKFQRGYERGSLQSLDEINGTYIFWDRKSLSDYVKARRRTFPKPDLREKG